MSHPIVALWAVPRSVSTAFERMMRERGDVTVFSEPFSSYYYFGPERVSSRFADREPDPGETFDVILDRVESAAEHGPVFVKDMAYHVAPRADDKFLSRFTNSFIVRDPRLALGSLAAKWPDFTEDEAGFTALAQLFRLARDVTGDVPPVIDGEDLRRDPTGIVAAWCREVGLEFDAGALRWEAGADFDDWQRWRGWYETAGSSTGFRAPGRPADRPPPPPDDPRAAELAAALRPAYEEVAAHRLTRE